MVLENIFSPQLQQSYSSVYAPTTTRTTTTSSTYAPQTTQVLTLNLGSPNSTINPAINPVLQPAVTLSPNVGVTPSVGASSGTQAGTDKFAGYLLIAGGAVALFLLLKK